MRSVMTIFEAEGGGASEAPPLTEMVITPKRMYLLI